MHDIRGAKSLIFETFDTRLAAALLTLGFDLHHDTDFTQAQIAFQIHHAKCHDYTEDEYGQLWRDRQWKEENFEHPFALICKVAHARDWLIGNVINPERPYIDNKVEPVCECFKTEKLDIAACIVAAGFYLMWFYDRTFTFAPEAKIIADQFADSESEIECQVEYLKQLAILLTAIKLSRKKSSGQPFRNAIALQL